MAAGSTLFDVGLFQLLFQNVTSGLVGIGDAAGLQPAAAAGGLYISLHTADPTKAGTQTASEVTYGAYARQPLARATTSWFVTAAGAAYPASAYNLTQITFPTDTGVSAAQTATYAGLGTGLSGTGFLLLSTALSANVVITAGVIPQFISASMLWLAD